MSREHAIYKQGPLQSTPLVNASVSGGAWDEAALSGNTKTGGFVFEATLISRKRLNLTDGTGAKKRYAVLTLDVNKKAFQRQYDEGGNEVEYAVGTTKKVSTGFLQSSWKDEQRDKSGEVTIADMKALWGSTFVDLTKFDNKDPTLVEIWGDETAVQQLDFENGESVRPNRYLLFF